MASEIRVDKINSLSGVGTVTLSPTGVDIAGITTAATLRATTGIVTSLTAGSLTSLGAVSGTTGTFSSSVSGTRGTFSEEVDIADKIIHTGDTDTAIRFPAADTITAETGGSERLRIDSNGNIGVNVTPTNYSNYVTLGLNDSTGSTIEGRVGGTLTGSFTVDSLVTINAVTSIPIVFKTANTERIRIEPTGNLKVNNNLSVTGIATVGSAVTISESGIEASGIGITCANINGTQIGGRRNKVINGAMQIAQRGTSHAMGNSANAYVTVDRFKITNVHDGAVTVSQSSTSPVGFSNSVKIDVTTADTSIITSQRLYIQQFIEAQDLQDLSYGTSGAKEARVSFYVRSNKTGNYTFALNQADNSFKNLSFQYAINSADTWERKSFVIPGDTAGVINNDNGTGIELYWWLAAGPTYTSGSLRSDWTAYTNGDFAAGQGVNLLDSTSNEFYLTGVQFEIGTEVTPFEHRSFGDELLLCQRYYYKSMQYGFTPQQAIPSTGQQDTDVDGYLGWVMYTTTSCRSPYFHHPVDMRTEPTVTIYSSGRVSSPTNNRLAIYNGTGWLNTATCSANVNAKKVGFNGTVSSALTAAGVYLIGGGFDCDAEL